MKPRTLKDILTVGFLLLHFQIISQHYFNTAIPFGPDFPTTADLYVESDNYKVFAISPSDSSMVISLNDDGSSDIRYYKGFNFSERAFEKIGQIFFSSIEVNSRPKGINLIQFDTSLNIIQSVDLQTFG